MNDVFREKQRQLVCFGGIKCKYCPNFNRKRGRKKNQRFNHATRSMAKAVIHRMIEFDLSGE